MTVQLIAVVALALIASWMPVTVALAGTVRPVNVFHA